MFTGIITHLGEIKGKNQDLKNVIFEIKTTNDFFSDLKIGSSIAINGVCLTVEKFSKDCFFVQAIPETLKLTNLSALKIKDIVNLEKAMMIGDRFDGHIVQGHIEDKTQITKIQNTNNSWIFTFALNTEVAKFMIKKGSVTINGVSLTISDITKNNFSICLIPHTFKNTNFKFLKVGDEVNIETDIVGKYILKKYQGTNTKKQT